MSCYDYRWASLLSVWTLTLYLHKENAFFIVSPCIWSHLFLFHRVILISICSTNIKNCCFQICRESIHLLTNDEFRSFGLGIGEMRLLVKRFGQDKERTRSESKLRKLIDDVRGKNGVLLKAKGKRPDNITVNFSWYNYTPNGKKILASQS